MFKTCFDIAILVLLALLITLFVIMYLCILAIMYCDIADDIADKKGSEV